MLGKVVDHMFIVVLLRVSFFSSFEFHRPSVCMSTDDDTLKKVAATGAGFPVFAQA